MKKVIGLFVLGFFLTGLLLADDNADIFGNKEKSDDASDIISVKYEKKSVAKALLLSSIFPGAGQFYTDKSNYFSYVYAALEIGFLGGYLIYDKKGRDAEDKYKSYALINYNRDYQTWAQTELSRDDPNAIPFYTIPGPDEDSPHFRLDPGDTQHFFEDIGKYDKYIFGWTDWYETYAGTDSTDAANIRWEWSNGGTEGVVLIGNYPLGSENADKPSKSALRQEYIKMRKDAETHYDKAETFTFLLIFNHLISAIDAARVTVKHNKESISQAPFQINFKTAMYNNKITPCLVLSKGF